MLVFPNELARDGEEPGDIKIITSSVLSRNGGLEDVDKELSRALLNDYLSTQPLED